MFESKKCSKCNEKTKKDFEFCPSCGHRLKNSDNEFGLLGRNDQLKDETESLNPLLGGLAGGVLGKMLGNTMRILEREMQKELQNPSERKMPNTKFELFVNGKKIDPKNIKVTKQPAHKLNEKGQKTQSIVLPENKLKKFSQLPLEEPETNLRRLSDSLIYEIDLPGVKSEKDLSIKTVENTIEIKAESKEKAYLKTINIGLPVMSYEFSKELLTLELEAKH
jgi:HSP20 family molecular chaperone IbpA